MKISVIIPCFRLAHLVGQTVESALTQTGAEFEVIVVDDGSPDDVKGALRRFGDQVRYVRQDNSGLSATRNFGVTFATGDLFLFLDADDVLLPGMFAAYVDAAGKNPGAILCGGWQDVGPNLEPLATFPTPTLDPDPLHRLLVGNLGPPVMMMVPRSVWTKVGKFDSAVNSREDWDYWLRAALLGIPFSAIQGTFALYRQYPDSMSRNTLRMCEIGLRVLAKVRKRHDFKACTICGGRLPHSYTWMRKKLFTDYLAPVMRNGTFRDKVRAVLAVFRLSRQDPGFWPHLFGAAVRRIGRTLRLSSAPAVRVQDGPENQFASK